jgi:hypothetical protein
MAMADAQYMHAQKMAQGQEAYQGKLLEIKRFRLEGRGSFINSLGANSNSCICSYIR